MSRTLDHIIGLDHHVPIVVENRIFICQRALARDYEPGRSIEIPLQTFLSITERGILELLHELVLKVLIYRFDFVQLIKPRCVTVPLQRVCRHLKGLGQIGGQIERKLQATVGSGDGDIGLPGDLDMDAECSQSD